MHGDGNGIVHTNNDDAMLYGANSTLILQARRATKAYGTNPFGRRVENSSTQAVAGNVRRWRRRSVIRYNHPNDLHDQSAKIGRLCLVSSSDGSRHESLIPK
jgi:hypothetical protein